MTQRGMKKDTGKARYDLMPWQEIEEITKAMQHAVDTGKYVENNWMYVRPIRTRYFAAAMRHLLAWYRGEWNDEETGYSHLAHTACCILFLMWGMRKGICQREFAESETAENTAIASG